MGHSRVSSHPSLLPDQLSKSPVVLHSQTYPCRQSGSMEACLVHYSSTPSWSMVKPSCKVSNWFCQKSASLVQSRFLPRPAWLLPGKEALFSFMLIVAKTTPLLGSHHAVPVAQLFPLAHLEALSWSWIQSLPSQRSRSIFSPPSQRLHSCHSVVWFLFS